MKKKKIFVSHGSSLFSDKKKTRKDMFIYCIKGSPSFNWLLYKMSLGACYFSECPRHNTVTVLQLRYAAHLFVLPDVIKPTRPNHLLISQDLRGLILA